MKLSVIIVNYNVRYFLEQCLLSVQQAMQGVSMDVWVVDNASVDDSVAMVQEKFSWVRLIANEKNTGFSVANNQAIRLSEGEFVLLLNPDTVVEEDTFVKCVAFMESHPDAGALGVRMIDGSGKFLPESKRGFPSPWVAFCKTFGLSSMFPTSKRFNHYHLGYLSEHETHEIEVLAGAFMCMRRKALDEVGLLDETFFMYGEDIDLSYRIVQGGWKNYYLPETTIIHYKGESTKKGSLNYVKVFYQAMIIFAKKHFQGEKAWLFVMMLQLAIYFRATVTLLSHWAKKLFLPLTDAALIFVGMVFLKNFWAQFYFGDPNYYKLSFLLFNIPLYITIWLLGVFFSGGYDEPFRLRRLVRGLLVGSLILAAVYGFLDMEWRTSRVLVAMGAAWALVATLMVRYVVHFLQFGHINLGQNRHSHLVIVGSQEESERVLGLLQKANVQKNIIGTVSPTATNDHATFLSSLDKLDEVSRIYKVNEIIFCSGDIPAQDIMQWMTKLGTDIDYRILPKESLSIIGSSSKNAQGELYTIDIRYQIASPMAMRSKRLLDIIVSLLVCLLLPLTLLLVKKPLLRLWDSLHVIVGKKTWVGYIPTSNTATLPHLKLGVFSPQTAIHYTDINEPTAQRLNFLFAKDWMVEQELTYIWKGLFINR